MPGRVLNMPLGDTSRLDRSNKYVLLWKPSVFIVLPIIRNQSKTKTIPHTVLETFINNHSENKTWWVLELGILEIFTRVLYSQKSLKLEVDYSGFFKCYKFFSFKLKKESPKRCEPTKYK